MNKLESTIPFCGFYCSFIDADIEHQIGQQIEWDSDIYDLNEDEQQILWDSYLSVNRSYFYNQIAEDYTNFYIDELNERLEGFTLNAKFNLLTSPKEYNFETDRIFIDIERDHAIDFIKYIIKNYKKELEKKIKERFTSRSGFNSFYKNSLDLWPKDYSEWDHNQIGTCFELFDLEEEDINYSLREYLNETIMDNLGNTLDKDGIDLLDNKQKEKDKKELMDKQQLKLNFN
jgi:hypothetical protein